MKTKTLAALLSAIVLLSANVAFACGRGYGGHVTYNYEKPHIVKAFTKRETAQSRAPAAPAIANAPASVSPSLAAGLQDSTF